MQFPTRFRMLAAALLAAGGLLAGSLKAAGEGLPERPGETVGIPGVSGSLHWHCEGEGTPTVVLEAGLGADSLHWRRVQPLLAEHTRVCAYDRAGFGWSDPLPGTRNVRRQAQELGLLLEAAGEPGPFILVGHSYGAWIVRALAGQQPEQVKGLVLVDPSHEHQAERFARELDTPVASSGSTLHVIPDKRVHPGLPEDLHDIAEELNERRTRQEFAYRELHTLRQSTRVMLRTGPPPKHVEVTILSRGRAEWRDPEGPRREALWRQLHQEQADAWGERVRLEVVAGAGHHIQLERPEAVVAAVLDIINH